jgi:hypothetical protein
MPYNLGHRGIRHTALELPFGVSSGRALTAEDGQRDAPLLGTSDGLAPGPQARASASRRPMTISSGY